MRFIHKCSYNCANYLMLKLQEDHDKRRIYYYGFQIIIGALVKGILLISGALILRTLIPTIVVAIIFASLRSIAGGYHMDTYGKCMAVSLGLFLVTGAIAQYTGVYWSIQAIMMLVIISFLVALIAVLKWAPSDTPNKPITDPVEIRKFKNLSMAYTIIWLAAMVLLVYYRFSTRCVIAACFGLILEVFTITPYGKHFFDTISGKVDRIKKAAA